MTELQLADQVSLGELSYDQCHLIRIDVLTANSMSVGFDFL